MTNSIELLKLIAASSPFDESAQRALIPQGTLRFILEYSQHPDLFDEIAKLKALLGSDNFELFSLPGDGVDTGASHEHQATSADADASAQVTEFGDFLVLQFPGVERTLSQRSLFDIAYALQDELDLMSAEPDLGSRVFQDPTPDISEPGAATEGVIRDAFTAHCWVAKPAPDNKRWPLDKMNIPAAWAMSPGKGEGVVIAQPDTGIAAHDELQGANLRLDLATNLVEGSGDPIDPLQSSAANPGHGTGTASVIISTGAGSITGAAPGAELVPIRCVNDVKIFDAAPLIAAINHAREIGAHVITMSLGGIPSRAMRKAIKRAVAADIIVVSAAGNCVELVVWPARYNDVIAVGGCNVDDLPWKGSSRGSDVDISAPAELVWVARRKPDDNTQSFTEGAQGTSFATALTASVAALWLSHHGRDTLLRTARQANINLQSLFRKALQKTINRPNAWPVNDYGSGIIDAQAMLQLSPADILGTGTRTVTPSRSRDDLPDAAGQPSAAAEILAGFSENTLSQAPPFDPALARFEQEIAVNVLESARVGLQQEGGNGAESAALGVDLSDTLKAAIAKLDDQRLLPLKNTQPVPPASRVSQALFDADAGTLARVRLDSSLPLESASSRNSVQQRASITPQAIKEQLDKLEQRINHSGVSDDNTAATQQRLKDEVLEDTEAVLNQLKDGGVVASNDVRATTALEALVKMQGRPVIHLDDQAIDIDNPSLQDWVGVLAMLDTTLPELAKSIGRIDADGMHQGTGFVVGPGLILTNRHVAEGFAAPVPTAIRPDRWIMERQATINFSARANAPEHSFQITDVLFSGADPISSDPLIDHSELDLAILAVDTSNVAGQRLPPALHMGSSANQTDLNSKLFLIGYPAAPSSFPRDENGRIRRQVVERVRQLFGMNYGICYLSPGFVETPCSKFTLNNSDIAFSHDATSLGGSSGSCILSCDSDLDVVGLHYGGDWLRANFAHDIKSVCDNRVKLPELFTAIGSAQQERHAQMAQHQTILPGNTT